MENIDDSSDEEILTQNISENSEYKKFIITQTYQRIMKNIEEEFYDVSDKDLIDVLVDIVQKENMNENQIDNNIELFKYNIIIKIFNLNETKLKPILPEESQKIEIKPELSVLEKIKNYLFG